MLYPQDNADTPAQEGEPDKACKVLAEAIKESTGEEFDVQNIVSTGKKIIEGKYSYTVNSSAIKKENPGYQLTPIMVSDDI